jgi:uncharacterized DUF497 family protein
MTERRASWSFDWDTEKAKENLAKHGVAFPEATDVFFDAYAWVLEEQYVNNEDRYKILGMGRTRVLCVTYTYREPSTIRLIAAWPASRRNAREYARRRPQ